MIRTLVNPGGRGRCIHLIAVTIGWLVGFPSFSSPPGADDIRYSQPQSRRYTVDVRGIARSYLVHLPLAPGQKPLPVILVFHGGGGSAAQMEDYSGMDASADRHGFLAVYPDGSGTPGSSRLLTWNAGFCCGYAQNHDVDDVGFIAALLDDLARHALIDKHRIYATGMSNGAMMADRLAEGMPEQIAAIAPVSGAYLPVIDRASRAVPVMHIHSVDDPRALYYGGLGPPFPLTNNRVQHPAVEDAIARWVDRDGCQGAASVAEKRSEEKFTATKYVYRPCRDNAEVVLWKLTGSGHVWPGSDRNFRKLMGESTHIIDANEEIWNFVSRYSLPR